MMKHFLIAALVGLLSGGPAQGAMISHAYKNKGIHTPAAEVPAGATVTSFTETFTSAGTGNQQINLTVPEVGSGAYVEASGSVGGILHDMTNDLAKSSSTSNSVGYSAFWTGSMASAVITATASMTAGTNSSSHRAGLYINYNRSTQNGYRLYVQGGDTMAFFREDSGSGTTLLSSTTASLSGTVAQDICVTRDLTGLFRFYVDGVQVHSTRDNVYTDPGTIGFYVRNNGQITSLTASNP